MIRNYWFYLLYVPCCMDGVCALNFPLIVISCIYFHFNMLFDLINLIQLPDQSQVSCPSVRLRVVVQIYYFLIKIQTHHKPSLIYLGHTYDKNILQYSIYT